MAKNLTAGELDVRRPHRAGVKGITDLAADILRDIADLFRAELQLLHAEVSEKITFVALHHCGRRFVSGGHDCFAAPGRHWRTCGLRSVLACRQPDHRRINIHHRWQFDLVRPQPPTPRSHGAIEDDQSAA